MNRNFELDFLKGIAIVAVVLYHFGVLPHGYLGVELFLVVNGYFVTRSLQRKMQEGSFSYFGFLSKSLVRLWPLVLMLSGVSLALGYFTMLPDDYENLAESAVASNVFANNILACITTKNYWDIVNAFKPQMHLWYVGIIMQMYVFYPLVLMILHRCAKAKGMGVGIAVLTLASLAVCMLPIFSDAEKFYYLPFRFYEMGIGGLIAVYSERMTERSGFAVPKTGCLVFVLALLLADFQFLDNKYLVLLTSLAAGCFLLGAISNQSHSEQRDAITGALAVLGKASYSLFIWHQCFFAFYIYTFNFSPSAIEILLLLAISIGVGLLSYKFIEQKIAKVREWKVLAVCGAALILTTGCGLKLYVDAGVVRDVPELEVSVENKHRGMHAEYCDRVYEYERPFENNGKLKVFLIGNSFARDMANILLESVYADSLDISYHYGEVDPEDVRNKEADVVFLLASTVKDGERETTKAMFKTQNIWAIGTKSFGGSNGNFYNMPHDADYYETRTTMEAKVVPVYYKEKAVWGDRYVDLVGAVSDEKLHVRVFTDDGKYISQDCRHLTQCGARYYARILPLSKHLVKD